MRLSPKEVQVIEAAFRECLSQVSFQLLVFGSRLDDSKKGGDIDLLLVVDAENKNAAIDLKSRIRSVIFKSIPEQKIDITVASEGDLASDIFLKSIIGSARPLVVGSK